MKDFSHIQFIFFDLDNTLWDYKTNSKLTIEECFIQEKIKDKYSLSFSDFHHFYYHYNEELWADYRDHKISKEELINKRFYESFKHFGIDDIELAQTFEKNYLSHIIKYSHLVDGAKDLLDYLAPHYSLNIISNGFQQVTLRKVVTAGIFDYFDSITASDEINVRKPNPEIFSYALNKVKATPENSLLIGDDWIADIIGAKNSKIDAIFFNPLNYPTENIIEVSHLNDIKNYI